MSIYALTQSPYSFLSTLDRGLSDDARIVRHIQTRGEDASYSLLGLLKSQALQEIGNAFVLASAENWDGYQAAAANPSAFSYALTFINQLPMNYPFPEVAIDTDGEIALEWDYEPRRIFSIRIGRDGSLNYAGLLGHSSFHGAETLRDNIPFSILEGINRVASNRL